MKIAIVTLPLRTNYGGILQCYALQTVLQRMGHEVYVLEKAQFGRLYPFIRIWNSCKCFLKWLLLREKGWGFKTPKKIISLRIDWFIYRHISRFYKRVWTLQSICHFDVFIVGSDQIWRPEYFFPIEDAFLAFTKDICSKRISYAASFGVEQCTYSEEQLVTCSSLLKKFDAVSVREDSGVRICKESFGVEAVQMLDPTLLLDAEDYRSLISTSRTTPLKGNMLVYILDETEEKKKLVEKIANERDLIPYWLSNDACNVDKPWYENIKMSVEQWLRAFDDATFVFTDSFHGCVFSILFRKPFIAIGNQYRGIARFTSLLSLFSLNERLIFSYEDYESQKQFLREDIDYTSVYEQLAKERNRSFIFLKNNLS